MSVLIGSVVIMALSFGLIHAFDADHIAAVTGLSVHKNSWRKSIEYCVRWAIGHSATLVMVAMLIYAFGLSISESVGFAAEILAGSVLIVIGLLIFRQIITQKIKFSVHRHDATVHAHLHKQHHQRFKDHSATLVGMVHGLAGSAPILVLIPLTDITRWWHVLAYVLLFSGSVVFAMFIFGYFLVKSLERLQRLGPWVISSVRLFTASLSIMIGVQLVFVSAGSL